MRQMALPFVLLAMILLGSTQSAGAAAAEKKAQVKRPADRVVVMYFHRTQRCPTCLKMGSYSEEAVTKGFAEQVKDGTVEFHYIDFQNKKNAALTRGYKISGPALVVAKVVKNKVVRFTDLQEIWTKNRNKEVFLKYVRDHVTACQKLEPKTALEPAPDTSLQRAK
ncbi:MAG: hypothetical protein JXB62_05800 [Pirellulales bacterium]|nr:hypothetical protein [Pirellulales bacterium]